MAAVAYLSGYGEFEDRIEHVRVGRDIEYYVDDHKAIFRVAMYRDDVFVAWRERAFHQPVQRQMMRIQIAMVRMGDAVTDLGSAPITDGEREICTHCDGFGTVEDVDGANVICTWCEGVGWH